MKKKLFLMAILALASSIHAQERKYSTFYYQRATLFEELPVTSSDIIFLGNSITNGGEWAELLTIRMSRTVASVVMYAWECMTDLMRW